MTRSLAVLFKAGGDENALDNDPYAEKLGELAIECSTIPVLNFEFINLNELKACIQQSEVFSGIIFSSPRVVEAVRRCAVDMVNWKDHFAFVVGEKTSEEVSRLGLNPEGSSSGTGAVLADHILKHNIEKPLLLPCGNLSTNTIYDKLTSNGVEVSRLVVYQTLPDPSLEEKVGEVVNDLADCKHKFMLYFSPSGVNATMPIFQKLGLDFSTIKFGAIGPTTQAALSSHVEVNFVAKKPTPQHFAEALEEALRL